MDTIESLEIQICGLRIENEELGKKVKQLWNEIRVIKSQETPPLQSMQLQVQNLESQKTALEKRVNELRDEIEQLLS